MNIYKKFIVLISLFTVIFFFSCNGGSWRDIFTFGAVKKGEGDEIENLNRQSAEYESQIYKKIESTHKLGIINHKLGDRYLERKAWTSAIDSYEKAIGYGKNISIVHYSLGVAYANRGKEILNEDDIKKAIHQYNRALEITPDYYDASYGLGILYFYVKDNKKKGIGIIKNLIVKNKKYYEARFALGRMYYELNNPRKSLSIYEDLHSDLQKLNRSYKIDEFLKNCKINIERIMFELARQK